VFSSNRGRMVRRFRRVGDGGRNRALEKDSTGSGIGQKDLGAPGGRGDAEGFLGRVVLWAGALVALVVGRLLGRNGHPGRKARKLRPR
jgi:hypothetical protein